MEILRIVRLTFDENKTNEFIEIFQSKKNEIRSFEGCTHLELMKDFDHPNVFYTYSKWHSQDALEAYRNSTLFKETWSKTKLLFKARASAYSLIPALGSVLDNK